MKHGAIVFVLLGGVAQADPAPTPPSPPPAIAATSEGRDDARKLFLAGRQAYQDARYDVAISSFEAANHIAPDPRMLFNLAQAYRKQFLIDQEPDTLRHAVDDYRRFVKEALDASPANRESATQALDDLMPIVARFAPPTPAAGTSPNTTPVIVKTEIMIVTEADAAHVALDGAVAVAAPLLAQVTEGEHHAVVEAPGYFPAEVKIAAVAGRLVVAEARLTARPGRIEVRGVSSAHLFLDGRVAGELPLSKPLEAPAGRHFVAVTERGRDAWSQEIDLVRGATAEVRPELHPSAQRRAAAWIGVISALALVGTAAPLGVWLQADSAASQINQQRLGGGISSDQLTSYTDDASRRDTWRNATYVAFGITGALAIITGALFLFDRPDPPRYVANTP